MSKKQKQKREHHKTRIQQTRPFDHRRSETITVAWVVSALACASAGILSAIGLYMTRDSNADSPTTFWDALTPLMLFIAAVTGLLVVCLTPLVYIFRRTAPPFAITIVALAIALFPYIALLFLANKA